MLKKVNKYASRIAYWCVPPGIEAVLIDVLRLGFILTKYRTSLLTKPYLSENRKFKNIHNGQRCFILGNGPSILKEDLTPLKDEICFSVSNFYKHPLYPIIQPYYHCVPNIAPSLTESDVVSWFTEMHEKTLNATIFLGFRQKAVLHQHKLFPGRNVNYLLMEAMRPVEGRRVRELSGNLINPQSVSIMCLILSLFMGFKKIYLLGIDHDHLRTGRYDYFYDRKEMIFKDPSVTSDGKLAVPLIDDFKATFKLWQQYILINEVAKKKGAEIINLSQGSYLDVFRFDHLSNVLGKT